MHIARQAAHTKRVGGPGLPDEGLPPPDGWRQRTPANGLPDPDSVVIPDDIAELEPDVRTYYRELVRRQHSDAMRRVFLTRRWERFGLSGPIVVAILCVVALFGSLASIVVPRAPYRPVAEPLAENGTRVGEVGGLLPEATLSLLGEPVEVRNRRPAVLALVPPGCSDCGNRLDTVYAEAKQERLGFDIIGAPADEDLLRQVDRDTGNGGADVLLDPQGVLANTYDADELTVLAVAPDGTIAEIIHDPGPSDRLGRTFDRMLTSDHV